MPRTPDRFERALDKHTGDEDDWRATFIPAERVVNLLRAEHRWFRDRINEHRRSINGFPDAELDERFKAGYSQACFEMLNLLTQRRK